MPEPAWLRLALDLVVLMFVGANWLYTRMAVRDRATQKQIEAANTRIDGVQGLLTTEVNAVERRLAKVEGAVEHLPTKESFHELAVAVTKVGGTVESLTERVAGLGQLMNRIEAVVDRQESYLMQQKGER